MQTALKAKQRRETASPVVVRIKSKDSRHHVPLLSKMLESSKKS